MRRDWFLHRLGAAAVETAVVLPLAVMIVFGSMELANGVFMKQALSVAAYEGARTITRTGATETEARKRIKEVLKNKGIENARISIQPRVDANTPRGTSIKVTVSADPSKKSVNPARFLLERQFEQFVVMVRL